jgi:hypothetical protein
MKKTYTPWIIVNSKTGGIANRNFFLRKYEAEEYLREFGEPKNYKVIKADPLTYKV